MSGTAGTGSDRFEREPIVTSWREEREIKRLCSAGFGRWPWLFFEDGKLDLLVDRIDAVYEHAYAIAQTVGPARALADDLARRFVISIAVVVERVNGDEPFDE